MLKSDSEIFFIPPALLAHKLLAAISPPFNDSDFTIPRVKNLIKNAVKECTHELSGQLDARLPENQKIDSIQKTAKAAEKSLFDVLANSDDLTSFKANLQKMSLTTPPLAHAHPTTDSDSSTNEANSFSNLEDTLKALSSNFQAAKKCLEGTLPLQRKIMYLETYPKLRALEKAKEIQGVNTIETNLLNKLVAFKKNPGFMSSIKQPIYLVMMFFIVKFWSIPRFKNQSDFSDRENEYFMGGFMKKLKEKITCSFREISDTKSQQEVKNIADIQKKAKYYYSKLRRCEKLLHSKEILSLKQAKKYFFQIDPVDNLLSETNDFLLRIDTFLQHYKENLSLLSEQDKRQFNLLNVLLDQIEKKAYSTHEEFILLLRNVNNFIEKEK